MTLKEQALHLLELGFRPIPLGAYQEEPPAFFVKRCNDDLQEAIDKWPKTPRIKWKQYQLEDPTEQEVEKWWTTWPDANIAILTGLEVYVVDADSEAAVEWVENYLPKTPWRVNTKKGRHYYYWIGDGKLGIKNSVNRDGKVDVRGVGGYVVAAGSRHSSGVYYGNDRLPHPAADHYNDLPELTLEDIQRIKHYNGQAEPAAAAPGSYANMANYSTTVEGEPGQPQLEGSRNIECARLVGLYIRQKYSISEMMDKVLAWDELNTPPLGFGVVERTIKSVIQTHETAGGHEVLLDPPVEKQVARLMFTLGELKESPPPAPETFWGENLIFRGARVLIAGEAKIGKSRFALAMAVQATIGSKFLQHNFIKPLKCMWMQAEIHHSFLPARVNAVMPSVSSVEAKLAYENLILSGRLDLDVTSERDHSEIRKQLHHYRPDVWIIDPIIEFSTAEENSNVEVRALLRRINALAAEINCAVVIVHHTAKVSKGKDIDFNLVRGASAFRGWFDTGILLTKGSTRDDVLTTWETRHTAPPPSHMSHFDHSLGIYECQMLEDPEQRADSAAGADMFYGQVYSILIAAGSMTMQQLIDQAMLKLTISSDLARASLAAMITNTQAFTHFDEDGELCVYASPQINQAAFHAAQSISN